MYTPPHPSKTRNMETGGIKRKENKHKKERIGADNRVLDTDSRATHTNETKVPKTNKWLDYSHLTPTMQTKLNGIFTRRKPTDPFLHEPPPTPSPRRPTNPLQHGLQVVGDLEGRLRLGLDLVDRDAVGDLDEGEPVREVDVKDTLQPQLASLVPHHAPSHDIE